MELSRGVPSYRLVVLSPSAHSKRGPLRHPSPFPTRHQPAPPYITFDLHLPHCAQMNQ